MPSFDTVCAAGAVEIKNAADNAAKEIGTRLGFKGTSAAIAPPGRETARHAMRTFNCRKCWTF